MTDESGHFKIVALPLGFQEIKAEKPGFKAALRTGIKLEVAQEAVSSGADIQKRIDQLKKDGKKSVLLLVSNGDGELRFVALSVQ